MMILINFSFLVFGVTGYVDEQWTLRYGAVQAGEPRQKAEKKACRKLGKCLSDMYKC